MTRALIDNYFFIIFRRERELDSGMTAGCGFGAEAAHWRWWLEDVDVGDRVEGGVGLWLGVLKWFYLMCNSW